MSLLVVALICQALISTWVLVWLGFLLLKIRDEIRPRPNDPEARW
jgi:hypothetical protein